MSYVAIYRKFRPQTFAQVKGQENIVQTLQNQIRNNRIGHAYLFTGTRGTGKTSVARILAKAINCKNPVDGEPCNECENCKEISAGNFLDVIEIDAASNTGVDDIRRVIEEVEYSPVSGRYKVYIIDEAHMLSGAAANAFLKTLEEPPSYAVFILATTEPHKLPVTILSRCQRYDFRRITTEKIAENIREYIGGENIEADDKAVSYIAAAGDGSMRDALSLLDKVVAFDTDGKITYEDALEALGTVDTEAFSGIFRAVLNGDAYGGTREFDKEIKNGKDISRFISDLVWYLRNLLIMNAGGGSEADVFGLSEENLKILKEDSQLADADTIMRYIRILSDLMNDLRFSGAKQVLGEVALIKLARPQMETDNAALLERIKQLESAVAKGVAPAERPAARTAPAERVQQEIKKEEPVKEPPAYEEPPPEPAPRVHTGGIPAEIVCVEWMDIVKSCSSPLLKASLEKTYVRKEDKDTVRLVADGDLARGRIESRKESIRELIKEVTGCEVALIVTADETPATASDETAAQDEIEIETLIKKNIKMDVETEGA